jgi:hypothetical protein
MSNIKSSEMRIVDRVLGMEGGYVLDFSDRTIANFFLDELNVDFNDPRFTLNGTSKAKRLRTYLQTVDKSTAARTLRELLRYRSDYYKATGRPDEVSNAEGMLLGVINRLEGKLSTEADPGVAPPAVATPVPTDELKSELIALHDLAPQPRGYAFERFLQRLFSAYGLHPHAPFRLTGEQIEGSFKYDGEFYLLEAKWQGPQTPAADLHGFHGKLTEKAAWARGLFISNSGFTADGLKAFGRAKAIVCMDGLDLWTMLDRKIPLTEVLDRKLRRAAEYGDVFRSVHDLF